MEVTIDIPVMLFGYIQSLEIAELDGDKILQDVSGSEHYYELISYGLINGILNDDDEAEHYLTHLGKIVYEHEIQ